MPRGKNASSKKSNKNVERKYGCPDDAPWLGYINLKVSEDERSDFDGWKTSEGDAVWAALEDQLCDGLKLGLSYDAENQCYIATFTGAGCVGIRERAVLSARSALWDEAVALLLYKHLILMDGDWSAYRPATGRMGTFG